MPRLLTNATVTHVSYVNKGANQKKFFLMKSSDETPTFTKDVKVITKQDDPQKLVYGVVYEPDVPDAHDDYMTAEEIEKAAHGFMEHYRNIDAQHDFSTEAGTVVQSYIAPVDMVLETETIAKGSWVLVTKATETMWEAIQKGDFTGYSLAGTAEVTEVAKSEPKTIWKQAKTVFANLLKGELATRFTETQQSRDLRSAFSMLEDIVWDEIWNDSPDTNRITEAANDFNQTILAITGGTTITKGLDDDMKPEDLQKALEVALDPIAKRLDKLEKGDESNPEPPAEPEPKDDAAVIADAIAKALEPVTTRLDAIEKAKPVANTPESTTPVQKDEGPSYLRHWNS